ncbi:MAG: hypothetical protein A3K03_02430 [Bdellovibrionales bacterium RIFOXYD1_FULL_44_7]|nr:MAG: hypothetical protein A3K03_02430 [Bdellovibrionales bacterium RIFOXYD1_FULL_44_7]
MTDVNKILLIGRLGTDPVQRTTKNGSPVVHFSLATSRRFKSAEAEEPMRETQWHNIVAWGKQGEACAQYLKKGSSVFIEGVVKTRKYEDKEGAKRVSFEVHAQHVNFLGSKSRQTDQIDEQGLH